MSATGRPEREGTLLSPEQRRLTDALLLSLLIHAWLLSLTFGSQGWWLPGFGVPWQDRRIEEPNLRVVVVPPQVTAEEPAITEPAAAEPSQQTWVEQPVASTTPPTPTAPRSPTPRPTTAAIVPKADRSAEANPTTDAATGAAPAQMPLRADRAGNKAPPSIPAPAVIAVAPTDEPTWVVPATPAVPSPVIAAAPSASIPETATPSPPDTGDATRARIEQEASERAVELAKPDPSKHENARLEAERQETERQATELQEAARVEAARVEPHAETSRTETARAETARAETARAEAARAETARAETARAETARAEAARAEAARAETARAETARAETARAETARAEAARAEAARVEVAQEADARREAARRAMGRQLDEEAARREAATPSAGASRSPPPPWSSARRYRLFGRSDPNQEILLYAEAWERKIQLNMTFDMVREAAKQPHTDPIVKVAIRSDGSVESVTFFQSSGVAAIDDAIRRIVDSQKPYQAFPPSLAREWDVIEIRRTWFFDMTIRLY
jgi:membrane protein involved in colicin uptake